MTAHLLLKPGLTCGQGAECFGFMIQWGLGRELLREIWALVAGDAGQLSTQQFITCLYLMDNAKQVSACVPPVFRVQLLTNEEVVLFRVRATLQHVKDALCMNPAGLRRLISRATAHVADSECEHEVSLTQVSATVEVLDDYAGHCAAETAAGRGLPAHRAGGTAGEPGLRRRNTGTTLRRTDVMVKS